MRKTSIYLDDEQADRLARLARAEGRPQAEIVREAISCYRPALKRDRNFALAGNFERIRSRFSSDLGDPRGRVDARLRRVTLVLDAAPLVALANAAEPQFEGLLRIRDEEEGQLVLPAPVAAESTTCSASASAKQPGAPSSAIWPPGRYDVACPGSQ
jgi:predicted DNA-binding protein